MQLHHLKKTKELQLNFGFLWKLIELIFESAFSIYKCIKLLIKVSGTGI